MNLVLDNPEYPNKSTFLVFNLGELEKGHNNLLKVTSSPDKGRCKT
jgi:hypothetical protein